MHQAEIEAVGLYLRSRVEVKPEGIKIKHMESVATCPLDNYNNLVMGEVAHNLCIICKALVNFTIRTALVKYSLRKHLCLIT